VHKLRLGWIVLSQTVEGLDGLTKRSLANQRVGRHKPSHRVADIVLKLPVGER